jgi:hypothetical protein
MKKTSSDINIKGATWTLGIVVIVIIACLFFFASRKSGPQSANRDGKKAMQASGEAFLLKPWKEKCGKLFSAT